MRYEECIQKSIDYIEENLKYDLDLKTCAKVSGYSVYHFLRIFKETVKLTPAEYIRKRRLSEIAKEIVKGGDYLSNIAFSYGFNSKENFIRAFKAEHHILPMEYKVNKNSLRLYDKISFLKEDFNVIPNIVEIDDFLIVAFKSDEKLPCNFWNKYNCKKFSRKLSSGRVCRDYGVSVINKDLQYFIGIKAEEAKGDLIGTVRINIKGGLYAKFKTPDGNHNNFVNNIHKTWSFIKDVWLINSEYEWTGLPQFETYTEDSRSFTENIYIPIKKRSS